MCIQFASTASDGLQDPAAAASSIGSRTTSVNTSQERELHLNLAVMSSPSAFRGCRSSQIPAKPRRFSRRAARMLCPLMQKRFGECHGRFRKSVLVRSCSTSLRLLSCPMAKEMTKFMVAVCLNQTSCAAPAVNDSSVPGQGGQDTTGFRFQISPALFCFCSQAEDEAVLVVFLCMEIIGGLRSYVYSPTPTAAWKFAWDTLASNPSVPASLQDCGAFRSFGSAPRLAVPFVCVQDTINNEFTFTALPLEAALLLAASRSELVRSHARMMIVRPARTTRDTAFPSPASPSEMRTASERQAEDKKLRKWCSNTRLYI